MIDTSPDLLAMVLKLTLGTMAFVWILWTVRNVNSRAVGMRKNGEPYPPRQA